MLKIGDFSQLSRISIRMLRHYGELGLLEPAETDPFTGYRYYSEEQLHTAGRIQSLKDMGFSLAEIGEMMRCGEDPARLEAHFCRQQEALRRRAEETAYRMQLLDTAQIWLRKDKTLMHYPVTIKTIPERRVASLRMTLPTYDQEGMAWDILTRETAPLRLAPDEPCLCSATFHDAEFKEADVDVELQKTVRGDYPDTAHVRFKTEPPVTVASAVHNGSYLGLDEAMRTVARWVTDNGYRFAGPAFCIYHVSPHETEDPEQFVTEICYPVGRA